MITHVRSIGFGVPSLSESADFYEQYWQLEPVDTDGDCVYFGASCPESHVLRLRTAEHPRVDLISFAARTAADVDRAAERVASHPQARLLQGPGERQDRGGGRAIWFLDCDGRTVEVAADVAGRVYDPIRETDSRPTGISHVVLNTTNVHSAKRFYEQVLDFQVSDWVEDVMCFMRTGPQHHILAFSRAPHTSLNHVAFEVGGLDEFMRATGAMIRGGIPPVWGPGRHGVGNNTFSYFQEPASRFVLEYTTAAYRIDEEHGWTPQVYPAEARTADQWGTANPRDELVNAALHGTPDPGLWTPPPR